MLDELRKPKIFGMAIFDWVATLLALISIMYYKKISLSLSNIIGGMLIMTLIAIVVHAVLGISTPLNRSLGIR